MKSRYWVSDGFIGSESLPRTSPMFWLQFLPRNRSCLEGFTCLTTHSPRSGHPSTDKEHHVRGRGGHVAHMPTLGCPAPSTLTVWSCVEPARPRGKDCNGLRTLLCQGIQSSWHMHRESTCPSVRGYTAVRAGPS